MLICTVPGHPFLRHASGGGVKRFWTRRGEGGAGEAGREAWEEKGEMGRERRKGLKEESRSELTSANPAVTQSADDPHIKVRLMV